ncbi:MAG: HAD-IIB family hydrolase [Phycisphaerae bacterium]|nr:HAD-IIB family hydrolase [Phycisphaerae bacterium]
MVECKSVCQLEVANLKGLFFDIDDTFSSHGKITPQAYQAAWKLYQTGMILVPLTGRPAGWCDHIARMWPVHAVIGENGAFYCMMKNGKMRKYYTDQTHDKEDSTKRLAAIRREVLQKVPGTDIAADQPWREFDLAIDHCEDVPRLSHDAIQRIVDIFKKHGAHVRVSSVHVNGWFGEYDKLTATRLYVRQELGMDFDECNERFVFIGDSPNDEPLFSFFKKSVGVANVQDYASFLKIGPVYVTKERSGKGFVELAEHIRSGR